MKKSTLALVTILIVAALFGGFLGFFSIAIPADDIAVECVKSTDYITTDKNSKYISFTPDGAIKAGLVFYQGGRVDVEAFSYAARRISEQGYYVALVRCSCNLAVLEPNAADAVIADNPEIERWFVGGFSLGGVVACSYATAHPESIEGIILLASYPNSDISGSDFKVLSISGENDGICPAADIEDSIARLPANAQFSVIAGGNHTGFSLYGGEGFVQSGDNEATIDKLDQQDEVIALITEFLNNL